MLFDSHVHLDSTKYDKDREFVVNRAISNGVGLMLNPGADFHSSRVAVELSEKYDFMYAGVGIHPHDSKDMTPKMLEDIKKLALSSDKVKAIGEIGLDYHYDHSPRDVQMKVFIQQLELANELGLPVIIHDREANGDVLTTLKKYGNFENGVLLHCYSGSAELVKEYIPLGAYFSIAGPVTFENNKKTPAALKAMPKDRILIETDGPYLTPHPHRGKRNEPMYVKNVCEKVAAILSMSYDDVSELTYNNACNFFGIKVEDESK